MTQCFFCQYKSEPSFKDIVNLEKFLTPRKKILPSMKSRLCAKHQRKMSHAIKQARFLGLMPYTSYQSEYS